MAGDCCARPSRHRMESPTGASGSDVQTRRPARGCDVLWSSWLSRGLWVRRRARPWSRSRQELGSNLGPVLNMDDVTQFGVSRTAGGDRVCVGFGEQFFVVCVLSLPLYRQLEAFQVR